MTPNSCHCGIITLEIIAKFTFFKKFAFVTLTALLENLYKHQKPTLVDNILGEN